MLVRTIICGLFLTLPSCAIAPLRHGQMAPPIPGTINRTTNPDSSAQLGIAEFYNDPLLTTLIEQALVNNRELKILEEEIQIASNMILARQGAYLPFVTFGTGAGVTKPSRYTPEGVVDDQLEYSPGKLFPNPRPNVQVGLSLFWQLDIWRELRNARDAAAHRYISTVEQRNYFVTRMVAEIADNYYRLMALDKRLETLDQTIAIQEKSQEFARALKEGARGTELAVQRFQAEVRKNQSEKLIVNQEIVEVENRINSLVNRYPQRVERMSAGFLDLTIHALCAGVPAQLLMNRPDIRQAERELEAAGLDVKVARAHFFPRVELTGGLGYEAFSPKFLFYTPDALVYNIAGNLVAPLINRKAIQAEYLTANARQLECVYNYQRLVLNAFTEVVNRMTKVDNYRKSLEVKKQQLESLEISVDQATKLFQNARAEYVDVLLAQRDLLEARTVVIETKSQQLSAIVNTYQALGGGQVFSHHPLAAHPPVLHSPPHPTLPAPGPARKQEQPLEELPLPKPVEQDAPRELPRPMPAEQEDVVSQYFPAQRLRPETLLKPVSGRSPHQPSQVRPE